MKLQWKKIWGDFRFFHQQLGWSYGLLFLFALLAAFSDGLGIALLLPLFKLALDGNGLDGFSLEYVRDLPKIGPYLSSLTYTLYDILIGVLVLFSIKGGFTFISTRYLISIRQRFMKGLRGTLIEKVCNLSYMQFVNIPAGKVENLIHIESARAMAAFRTFNEAMISMVVAILYIGLALSADLRTSAFLVVAILLSGFIFRYIFKLSKKYSLDISKSNQNLASKLNGLLQHYKYLKASGRLSVFKDEVLVAGESIEHKEQQLGKYAAMASALKEPFVLLIVSLLLMANLHFLKGNNSLAFFSLLMFYRAFSQLMQFQSQWNVYLNFGGSIQLIKTFNEEPTLLAEPNGVKPFRFEHQIFIHEVEFSYQNKVLLQKLSFKVKKNEFVWLKGASGSGKSTLLNLLSRLIEPSRGIISIDGVPLQEIEVLAYRDKLAYITQENVVFEDTLFNNISFWDEPNEKNKQRYQQVLGQAGLLGLWQEGALEEEVIKKDRVSVGQAQRIAIARELYREAEIFLMDEITASLDPENEYLILETLQSLKGIKTILMVSHQDQVASLADRVIEIS
jgi:ABC-type multidrug transport system fused ATPase/permease subunit